VSGARYPRVTHPFAAFPYRGLPLNRFSLDLHVLSTPPAFVLSQDQTLRRDSIDTSDREPKLSIQKREFLASRRTTNELPKQKNRKRFFQIYYRVRHRSLCDEGPLISDPPLILLGEASRQAHCSVLKVHIPPTTKTPVQEHRRATIRTFPCGQEPIGHSPVLFGPILRQESQRTSMPTFCVLGTLVI
jgi:hypothetical protein